MSGGSPDHGSETHVVVKLPKVDKFDLKKSNPKTSRKWQIRG
jgi:hypothetical protein